MNDYSSRDCMVSKTVHRNIAYYSVKWSSLYHCSRSNINGSVPSLSGIWELYLLEGMRVMNILKIGRAWYGGLRNELRVETDETEYRNYDIREHLNSARCYYRYVVCEIAQDLDELYAVIASLRHMPGSENPPSQRYTDIRISEPTKLIMRHPPHEPSIAERNTNNYVPNMFDILEYMKGHKND